ncbi:putative GPI anchored protein [Aspergillus thermomutatus]|uniref:GPI anchored protein n=1 Tax=Aspergillus thermomutatus TaxID=41047 RepID=A0A397HX32_ASPTH|nr:uncharacterized protein CDV56_101918 [Aspergillus thermomutatus]RHZ65160.1 hypothetical protein CDV56_101918 [Aspergillus thermomutatus]
MKGLVGGIPLALLVAAVANGHGMGQGHGDTGHGERPATVIGGPSGDDGGNSAAIGFDSSYSSSVKDTYKDDHSFHLKNHVVAPPPPPVPGFRKRGNGDGTVIKGPSGDDGGNEAEIEFDSAYSSVVEDWVKDDHSADIKNNIFSPGFRKRGDHDATVIGGPSGNDGGNSLEIEFDSSYSSVVEDWYKDDHSLNEENHIVSPPPMPGFRRRGDRGATVIGGPSGNDGGNSAEVDFDSSYDSTVKDWYKDDHSIDIKNDIVHPPPMPGFRKRQGNTVIGGPSGDDAGNSAEIDFESIYTSSVKDFYKDDHSVDVENHIIHPPPMPGFRKRQGNTVIGGPSGDDAGNSAEIEFESTYTSSVKDFYKDDHSVDVENHVIHPPPVPGFRKRDDGGNHVGRPHHDEDGDSTVVGGPGKHAKHHGDTVIGGPSGDDGGSSADTDFDSHYSSEVEDHYKDDHSVDIKNHVFAPAPPMGFRRRGGPVVIGGPSGDDEGNSASFIFDSDYSSEVNDDYEDDHSVTEENWIGQPPPQPPHPYAPPFGGPAPSKPCSTSTIVETIVRTISEDPAPTKPAVPYHPSEHPHPESTPPSVPAHESSYPKPQPSVPSDPSHSSKPSPPSYTTHPSEAVPTGVSPTHEAEPPKSEPSAPGYAPHEPGFEKPEPARTPCPSSKSEAHSEPSAPSYPPQQTAHPQPEYSAPAEPSHEPAHPKPQVTTTPCPTRKPEGHHPEPTAPPYQPHQPEHSVPEKATPITSTITVSHTSSFAVVPVYVPSTHKTSCSSEQHQRPSAVDPHSNSAPSMHHEAPPTPSQSAMFTGAAGRMTPAGAMSAVCGLLAVLAFVL